MKKLSLRSILLGGGITIFIPLICYFILRSAGHTGHIKVPDNFGIDTIISKTVDGKTVPDTIYHTIQDISLVSHLNDSINLAKDYPRKVLVVNFISTNDTGVSNLLTYHMKHIQKGFKMKKTDTAIQLVTITTNPEVDDVATIRNYADKHTYDHDTWTFLTGQKEEIEKMAINELMIPNAEMIKATASLDHIVLVDKYRNIRGYYNGLDSMEIIRCIDDIAILMVEKNKIHERKRR